GKAIFEAPFLAADIRERQAHVALTLVGGVVDRDCEALALLPLPRERQKTIVRPVAVPGGGAVQKLPLAVAKRRLTQQDEQTLVEFVQLPIDLLARPSAQMRRDAFSVSLELALVKEAQARRQKGYDGSRLVDGRRKRRGGARLVMVLQKAGQLV